MIKIILEYKDLFDGEPLSIDSYLYGIDKNILIDEAIRYCSLSTILEPSSKNILFPFLEESDKDTDYLKILSDKVVNLIKDGTKSPIVINVRTSLKFFELVKAYDSKYSIEIPHSEIRKRLLKVYLLLNMKNEGSSYSREKLNELVIANSLVYSIYSDVNIYNLRIVEIIKSCIFLEYCEEYLPIHLNHFLKQYSIDEWKYYPQYLHEIGNISVNVNINIPVRRISVSVDDTNYNRKIAFLDQFCIENTYQNDQDYTEIKSFPVEKDCKTGEYRIIFEQFFIEKIYKSLYFTFKTINHNLKETDVYIKEFRNEIGLKFSEQVLLNKILKDSLGNKYKHLGYKELTRQGLPDYYIRDGKHILLFECKDNLIKKEILESADINVFLSELKKLFLSKQNTKGKKRPKAIKQLIRNIAEIRNETFDEDKGIKPYNIIYPIIVTHNSIFSLPGVNDLLNDWFSSELEIQEFNIRGVKNVTIVDIDTLVLYQGLFSQKENSLRKLIDKYWETKQRFRCKKYQTKEEAIIEYHRSSQSFKSFLDTLLFNKNVFTKEIKKYSEYFK